jgi:hypothetical protein
MGFLCDECDAEFPQTPMGKQEWLLHRAGHKSASIGTVPETASKKSMTATEIRISKDAEAKAKAKPHLVYKWEGVCDTCANYLDTIEVDVGQPKGKTVVVAFCATCRKQVAYRPAEKL